MMVGAGRPASSEWKQSRHGATVQSGFAGQSDCGHGKRDVGAPGRGSLRRRRFDGDQVGRASARQRRAFGTPARTPARLQARRPSRLPAGGDRGRTGRHIEELRRRLVAEKGVRASTGTIWTFLDRCGLTFKKKSLHAAEQDRPDVVERREDWFEAQLDLDPAKLVFVDESFASTNMARRYGRAPRGVRLRAAVPHGHRKKTTLVAGLRLSGVTATQLLDGSTNGEGTSVKWPVGLGGKGNEGVTGLVKQTPYSIGYAELIYALQNKLPFGTVQNSAGEFVKASLESTTAAAAGAAANMPADFRVSITNPPGKTAYPVASFTWLLIPQHIADAN